jgi:acetolactate synthase-1/2/3 large subunit
MSDTVAKFLIEELYVRGVDTYFGIPGGPIGPLFDGIYRTPGTKLIESRHETAALFEAIGYYKATGKIPVVLVTAGPGITNALTGIASAKALRIPVLILCGDTAWEKRDHILLQTGGPEGINIEHTFTPHTDRIIRCRDPRSVVQEIANLLGSRTNLAPSIAILPLGVNNAKIDPPVLGNSVSVFGWIGDVPKDNIDHIQDSISSARHPLAIVGYGAHGLGEEVTKLLDNLAIPFVTTPQAKGIVSENHPMALRHAGIGASQWAREYVTTTPDVVIALGTDLDDCAIGTTELIGPDTKLIHIDTNPRVFNRKYKTELPITCDIKKFCQQWLTSDYQNPTTHSLSHIKQKSAFDVPNFDKDISYPIAPHRVLADLQASSPNDVRFVTDIGEHMIFCLHYLTISGDRKFSIDLGLGSMGSGICQAIGMCLGDRQPTICVCGDGCFQMHGMEILTAIKYNLPIIFVIFNDARYNMVTHGFNYSFGIKVNPGQTNYIDFIKMAEALGIKGAKITEAGQINPQMMEILLNNNGPAILDVRINKEIRIKGAGRNEVLKHMGE